MTDFWTTKDLRRGGLSPREIRKHIAQGSLERLAHGLYVSPKANDLTRLRAIRHRWPHVVFSGLTAAYLYGWEKLSWPISGLLPRQGSPIETDTVRLSRASISRTRVQQDLRVTSPVFTAQGLIQAWPRAKILNFLERSYSGLTGSEQYHRDFAALNPAAKNVMRKIAGSAIIGASSQTERRLAHALAEENLFTQSNVRVGPYVFDLKVVGQPILVEVDGQQFHTATDVFVRDRWKSNAAQRAGYLVLRYSDTCVDYALDDVVAQILHTARSPGIQLHSDVQAVHKWHRALHSSP
ncbi:MULTISPECIES: DUF559 domain-containing protein [unclassified Corynebacterium]|uniref:DUF559 domain-containing protein n=1 Tax=unclassified Corynebacterium TaxID=2624378 RepID=UPI0029C9E4CA|nr:MULTISPECIES: DUF559 domain-containing protein [unclassified Corynebacterium]WPF66436.1 DUF559 domain-containing protein [Corynebacterium sp. 22KM0430]WPF68926.1 DUF559 domain-containing protein [Corynebacterium sp. 21KM1197]